MPPARVPNTVGPDEARDPSPRGMGATRWPPRKVSDPDEGQSRVSVSRETVAGRRYQPTQEASHSRTPVRDRWRALSSSLELRFESYRGTLRHSTSRLLGVLLVAPHASPRVICLPRRARVRRRRMPPYILAGKQCTRNAALCAGFRLDSSGL